MNVVFLSCSPRREMGALCPTVASCRWPQWSTFPWKALSRHTGWEVALGAEEALGTLSTICFPFLGLAATLRGQRVFLADKTSRQRPCNSTLAVVKGQQGDQQCPGGALWGHVRWLISSLLHHWLPEHPDCPAQQTLQALQAWGTNVCVCVSTSSRMALGNDFIPPRVPLPADVLRVEGGRKGRTARG